MADDDDHDHDHDDDHHAYLRKAYGEHKKSLNDRARRLSNGRFHDAEDLVQETFYRALIYPMNPEEIRNPRGYLLRVMRNTWISKWKRERTARTESLDAILDNPALHPTVEPDVLRIAENNELLEQLSELRGALTHEEKSLLDARLGGQTLEEIAATLNVDEFRTRACWYKLKAKLSRLIKSRNAQTKRMGRP